MTKSNLAVFSFALRSPDPATPIQGDRKGRPYHTRAKLCMVGAAPPGEDEAPLAVPWGGGRDKHAKRWDFCAPRLTASRDNGYNLQEIPSGGERKGLVYLYETYLATKAHTAQTRTWIYEAHVDP